MKKKFLMHVLALVLACSAVCFVGCGTAKDPVTSSDDPSDGSHTHTYDLVAREESTCVTQGHSEYYVCDGCDTIFVKEGDGSYTETDLASLTLPLAEHSFNGISVDASNVTTEYTSGDEFDEYGLKVTKTCSVKGCKGVAANSSEISISYTDSASCLVAGMDHVVVSVGDWTANVEVTVSKKVIELPTIASKQTTGAVQVADVPASDDYEVTENKGGKDKGTYDVILTVKDKANCTFKVNGEEVDTVTLKFQITAGPNPSVAITGDIADVICGDEPVVTATADDNPSFTYVYALEEDGEFLSIDKYADGLYAGTWYVKAIAAETENYSETASAAKSFTVKHGFKGYKQGETADTPVCHCGESVEGEAFQTVATEANYVLATAEALATGMQNLKIEGVGTKDNGIVAVNSIKCGDLDLGTATSPNVANYVALVGGTKGEKSLKLEITDTLGYEHTVTVPLILVTEFISDWETLLYKTQMHTGHDNDACIFGEGEYYALSGDITATGATNTFKYNDVEYTAKDYSSWGYAQSSYADMKGFSGTFDGAGYTIRNVDVGYCGIFASLRDATVKNVNIIVDNFSHYSGLLANHVGGTTIENINIIVNSPIDFTSYEGDFGVIIRQFAFNSTVKNVNVYAPGSKIKYIIAQGHYASSIYGNNTYENIHCYAASAETFTQGDTMPEGSSIVVVGKDDAFKTQYFAQADDKATITLPEAFKDYTVTKVLFNGKKLGSGVEFKTEDVLDLIDGTSKVGEYSLALTLEKDGHKIVLQSSAAIASAFITSWNELRYYVSYRSGVDAAFGKGEYYVLANDIVGGNPESEITDETYGTIAAASPAWGSGDLNIQSGEEGGWSVAGFAGTLDGAGYTVSAIDFASVSLFGSFNGGTVKNINLAGTWYSWGWSIFGGSGCVDGATIENVNVTVSAGFDGDFSALLNNEGTAPANNAATGIFFGNQMTNTTIKNVVVHAEEIKLKNILGPGAWGSEINTGKVNGNKIANVKVYVKDYETIVNNMSCINSRTALRVYTVRKTIELTPGETFALKLPYGFEHYNSYGDVSDMQFYRLRIDGKDAQVIVSNEVEGGKDMIMGGVTFKQQDLSSIPADNVLKFFVNDDGTYKAGSYDCEIEFTASASNWTYAYDNFRLLVTLVVPEGSVPGTEAPEGGDNTGTEVTDPVGGDTQTDPVE